MPPRPQRLVRHQPWSQRIQAFFNLMDWWLWLSEEIQTFDWDSRTFGIRFGLAANFIFMVARANATWSSSSSDDVFGDVSHGSWVTWLAQTLVWTLASISLLNAFYTMTRSRHYRLFEANVEQSGPSTPSAQRVRVDSSPAAAASPFRLFKDLIGESAEARAHPDKSRDVWEIAVWDPYPATLQIFGLFSPGHVLVHMLFLPLAPLDPRPSVTVFQCLVLQVILSTQLLFMQSRYTQQAKDNAIIHKEVMREYDTKYVHPQLHPVMREASTQITLGEDGTIEHEYVDAGTPATLIRRGFRTNPNPNYAKHFDPDNVGQHTPRNARSSNLFTPVNKPWTAVDAVASLHRTPGPRPSAPSPAPQLYRNTPPLGSINRTGGGGGGSTNFGGSLGVFSHMNSPLKKATSISDLRDEVVASPRNGREMAALEQREQAERMIRQSSPIKENRRATSHTTGSQTANPWARPNRYSGERFPSLIH